MILDTTSSSRTDRPSKAAKPAASAPRSTASASQRSASAPSSGTHRKRRRRFTTIVYFSLLLVYLEVIFHILMFHNIRFSLIYPILFALTLGTVLGTICRLFKRQVNRILMVTFTAILCVLFCSEVIYKGFFDTYYALFGVLGVAGQALDFLDSIFRVILSSLIPLVLLFVLPVGFVVFFAPQYISLKRKPPLTHLITIAEGLVIHIVMLLCLLIGGRGVFSGYDLYFHTFSVDESVDRLGVMTTTYLSGKIKITGGGSSGEIINDETPADTSGSDAEASGSGIPAASTVNGTDSTGTDTTTGQTTQIDTSPNILNIDFDKILSDSGNSKDVASLVDYMKNKSGTNKNQYTGMFKGYNLIWISAEGLDECIINESWTPTLYKMATQGFHFKNYYSPLWYGSTSGGEWANLTGTVPNNGKYVSLQESGNRKINMLFTAGRQSTRLGYHTTGWHNNSATYYGRNLSFPNMGYEWHGSGDGYDPEVSESSGKALWPQSDIRLIDQSFDKYASDEPFMTYYMSVSGHVEYNFSGNAMSVRNKDKVANLTYSDTAKAYIACQLELEYAMQDLLQRLENAGIADRTLIVLAPDHVPYSYMSDGNNIVEEIKGTSLDEIESYRNTLIIYSPSMQQPVEVDKYCCSVDILPTVSNLMGWDYDSRMMVGQDILSDSEQFVMFPGLSFITDKCIYNKKQDKITSLTGEEISQDYISQMSKKAYNWYTISDLLYSTDFYKYVESQMPAVSSDYQAAVNALRSGTATTGTTTGTSDGTAATGTTDTTGTAATGTTDATGTAATGTTDATGTAATGTTDTTGTATTGTTDTTGTAAQTQ